MYDPTATSSTNLIQIGTLRQRVRRQTAGQVAHTQRPERKTILLEHVIAPPHTVSVDFTPVLHIADELNSLQHHFGQLWPVDLPVPDTTNLALGQLEPIGDARPIIFHSTRMDPKSVTPQLALLLFLSLRLPLANTMAGASTKRCSRAQHPMQEKMVLSSGLFYGQFI